MSSIVLFLMLDLDACLWFKALNVILKLCLIGEIWSTDPDYNKQLKRLWLIFSLFPFQNDQDESDTVTALCQMNGTHTHAEASRSKPELRLEFWLHKLTLVSVFLNGEPRNFPLSWVHVKLFSEQLEERGRAMEGKMLPAWEKQFLCFVCTDELAQNQMKSKRDILKLMWFWYMRVTAVSFLSIKV